MPSERFLPLIVIVGPTAVGKTEISIQLAERLEGEIVSADSRLLYRGMDIGTAKPSPQERSRVSHHLIDVADPDEIWSLGVYQQAANRVISEIHARHRLPLLVGGTGQYVRAIVEGWTVPKVKPHPRLRQVLESWAEEIGPKGLHDRLAVLDPKSARKIDHRNLRRTIRALEVILRTGRLFSSLRRQQEPPYHTYQVGLTQSREELYARVDARIDTMLERGFIAEVKALLDQGYSPDLPTLSAIGYREVIAYLRGKVTVEQAVTLMKRRTRQFVRRQANWFKEDDPDIHWLRMSPHTLDELERSIRAWLALQV